MFPRRVADWRLGRWVAKRAVAAALGADSGRPEQIEVLATPGGAPAARLLSEPGVRPLSLSLSHSGGVGFAAAAAEHVELGCDVESLEARSVEFVEDYFTESERAWIRDREAARDLRPNILWSAKESALKALGEGLRMDTRSVEVAVPLPAGPDPGAAWGPLRVAAPDGRAFSGFWRVGQERVWTVVAGSAIRLEPDVPPPPG